MLTHWNFIEPIEEDESNYKTKSGIYIKPSPGVVKQRGIVKHPSKFLIEQGVKKGDKVIFDRVADYKIIVEGETYYRVQDRHIEAVDATEQDYDMVNTKTRKKADAMGRLAARANEQMNS
jgi:co-chaperonin GroES (HSP10)